MEKGSNDGDMVTAVTSPLMSELQEGDITEGPCADWPTLGSEKAVD